MLDDFKKFIARGNALDLAVGVVIGASFGAISKSLVDDVLMPPLGLLLGNVDFSNIFIVLKEGAKAAGPYATLVSAKQAGAVTVNVGLFVNTIVNFLIVAFAIYLLLKIVSRFERKQIESEAPTLKSCPYCITDIPIGASRCPHCTSELH